MGAGVLVAVIRKMPGVISESDDPTENSGCFVIGVIALSVSLIVVPLVLLQPKNPIHNSNSVEEFFLGIDYSEFSLLRPICLELILNTH